MAQEALTHRDRIIQDSTILAGKPVVRGTRIPVEVVLEYLARNPDFAELFADYPRLTMDDVKACLEYARMLVQEEAHVTGAASMAERDFSSMRDSPFVWSPTCDAPVMR